MKNPDKKPGLFTQIFLMLMKTKILLIFAVISCLLYSCGKSTEAETEHSENHQNTLYKLSESKTKTLKISGLANKRFANVQQYADKLYVFHNLAWLDEDPFMDIYDEKTGTHEKTIHYPRIGENSYNTVGTVYVKNQDSIFLINLYKPYIFLTDSKGNILRKYSLFDKNGELRARPNTIFQGAAYRNKLFLHASSGCLAGDLNCYAKLNNFSELDLESGEFEPMTMLPFSREYSQKNFSVLGFGVAFNEDDETFVSTFPGLHSLYLTDPKSRITSEIKTLPTMYTEEDMIQGVPLKTMKDGYRASHYNFNHNYYEPHNFFYDSYRKVYYRFVIRQKDLSYQAYIDSLKAHPNDSYMLINNRAVIIYDRDFNIIGEQELSKNLFPFRSFINKEGLWLKYNPENESEDSLYFRLLKLETK